MKKLLSIILSIVMITALISAVPVNAEVTEGDVTYVDNNAFYVQVKRITDNNPKDYVFDQQYYVTIDNVVYTYTDKTDYGTTDATAIYILSKSDVFTAKIQSEIPDYAEGGTVKVTKVSIERFNNVKEIEIADGITEISGITRCRTLEKVYIGKDVSKISNCFYDCENFKEIVVDKENNNFLFEDGELYKIGKNKKELLLVLNPVEHYVVKDDVTSVCYPFSCSNTEDDIVKSITVNRNLDKFEIAEMKELVELKFAENVTEIKRLKVKSAPKIKEIDISGLQIDEFSFKGCRRLEIVKLPKDLKEISMGAFYYCKNLSKIEIPDTVTKIGNSAFRNCSKLENIELPDGLKTIGKRAFYLCGIKKITIPASVTRIKAKAFLYSALTKVYFEGKKVPKIGKGAFMKGNKLIKLYTKNKTVAKKLKAEIEDDVYRAHIYAGGKRVYKNVTFKN